MRDRHVWGVDGRQLFGSVVQGVSGGHVRVGGHAVLAVRAGHVQRARGAGGRARRCWRSARGAAPVRGAWRRAPAAAARACSARQARTRRWWARRRRTQARSVAQARGGTGQARLGWRRATSVRRAHARRGWAALAATTFVACRAGTYSSLEAVGCAEWCMGQRQISSVRWTGWGRRDWRTPVHLEPVGRASSTARMYWVTWCTVRNALQKSVDCNWELCVVCDPRATQQSRGFPAPPCALLHASAVCSVCVDHAQSGTFQTVLETSRFQISLDCSGLSQEESRKV